MGPGDKVLDLKGGCHNCPRKLKDFVAPTLKQTDLIVLTATPLAGEAEMALRDALETAGLTDYSITSAIHCRPPKGAAPTKVETTCCLSQYVLAELASYKFVLMVGGVPASALFPGYQADRLRGNLAYHPDFPNTRFFGCYDPAYTLRRRDAAPELHRQLQRLQRIVVGEGPPAYKTVQGDSSSFAAGLETALASGFISLDIETDRLESWHPAGEIRSIALAATEDQALFVHNGEPHWVATVERIQAFLKDPASRVLGHNIGFDLVWMESHFGFNVRSRNIWDTSHLYYLARGDKMPHLKGLVSRELDGYRHLVFRPHEEKDLERLALYNAEDVIYPIQLLKKGLGMVSPQTVDLFLRVGGPSGFHLRRMEHRGFHFDYELWSRSARTIAKRRRDLIEKWQTEDKQFNPRVHISKKGAAGAGIEKYLFQIKGYPVIKKTKSERPSTDSSVLKTLVKQLEDDGQDTTSLKNLLLLRKYDKEEGTYVEPYKEHVGAEGLVRSSFTNTWTDSGRRSSRKPNIQNLPRKGIVRQFFAARPGNILLQGDFSQIELRIAMCLAGDPAGIAAYQRGDDLHTETARAIAGEAPTKEQRTHAKATNFSLIYGGSYKTVQDYAFRNYGIWLSDEDAKLFCKTFFTRYQHLQPWHERTHQELRDNKGKAMHIAGHPYEYAEWDNEDQKKRDHAFRAHLNSKCQGPAAYINMYTLILSDREIVERNLPARIVHEEHDSTIVDCHPDVADECALILHNSAQQVAEWIKDWFVVPLVVEFERGPNRGQLEEYTPAGLAA